MSDFESFLTIFTDHEIAKTLENSDTRQKLMMVSGARLNWVGDFLGNENIKWELIDLPIEQILFTGTSPEWNEILIQRCLRSPQKFRDLIESDKVLREEFARAASFGDEPIIVRHNEDKTSNKFKIIDGSHRLIGAILLNKSIISAYYPVNEFDFLPNLEPHVLYDLIRGYMRNGRNNQEMAVELKAALKLLCRTYSNAKFLLQNRFDQAHVNDPDIQLIIQSVLQELAN